MENNKWFDYIKNDDIENVINLFGNNILPLDINYNGFTPLYSAITFHRFGIVKYLVNIGVDIYYQMYDGNAIHHSITSHPSSIELVKYFIELGIDINFKNECDGNTPLHIACLLGNRPIVNVLLKNNANILINNKYGFLPIKYAMDNKYYDIVELLLEIYIIIKEKQI